MQSEFITARFPEGAVPRTSNRETMLRRVHTFIQGESRIREAGGDFGPWKSEPRVLHQVRARVDEMGVGPKLIIQRRGDGEQLSIREVEVEPPRPDLGCNPLTEDVHYALREEFGDDALRSGGRYLCRFVDGSTTVSKHGFRTRKWKGTAEDEFVTSGGMPMLLGVADFVVRQAKSGILVVQTVIVERIIRTAPDFEPRPYPGKPHYHLHHDEPGGSPCSP